METTLAVHRTGLALLSQRVRDAWNRWQQNAARRRDIAATYEMLRHLDDATLRDLAFDRSELSSVAIEAGGLLQRERRRSAR